METLTSLRDNAFQAFGNFFLEIGKGLGSIALKTAAEIAIEMTTHGKYR